MNPKTPTEAPTIDAVTVLSLLAVLALLTTAYLTSLRALPSTSSTRTRTLFIWHLFDALIHFVFEGSFLYNCLFTYMPLSEASSYRARTGKDPAELYPPGVHFYGKEDRVYGPFYGTSVTAILWQEYARADRRWGGSDLTIVSLEILTVVIGGSLAAYVCYLLSLGHGDVSVSAKAKRTGFSGKLAFWMIVLATGELYGGFMTFAPEWLSGSTNLDTSHWLFTWVYLFFFNTLWVWIPLWVLYEAFGSLSGAAPAENLLIKTTQELKKNKKR